MELGYLAELSSSRIALLVNGMGLAALALVMATFMPGCGGCDESAIRPDAVHLRQSGDGQLFTLSWSTRKSFEDHRTNGLDVFVA